MKNLVFIVFFFAISCKKSETKTEFQQKTDSAEVILPTQDSVENGAVKVDETAENGNEQISNTFRTIEGNKVIKTINGDMIPLSVKDEFTNEQQQFVIKIKNFKNKKISAIITPENPQMNIRLNQIKLANGDYDGPFGRDFTYDISQPGEIWLIIGKSNMASGIATGKFSVKIQ